jgi:hypothetical protein
MEKYGFVYRSCDGRHIGVQKRHTKMASTFKLTKTFKYSFPNISLAKQAIEPKLC